MKRSLNPVVVGAFVLGAALLVVIALMSFGAGGLFRDSYRFVVLIENSSVSGLDLGSPVKLSGVRVGRVESVSAQYEPDRKTLVVRVVCDLDYDAARSLIAEGEREPDELMHDLIAAGLQARLAYIGITGLLYVELGMVEDEQADTVVYETETGHPVVPLAPSLLSEFTESMNSIAANLAEVDFAGISNRAKTLLDQLMEGTAGLNLARTAGSIEGAASAVEAFAANPDLRGIISDAANTLRELREMIAGLSEATPEFRANLDRVLSEAASALEQLNQTAGSIDLLVSPRGGLPDDLERTLQSVQRAAQSIERLADYLERHPSALLRGRAESSANPR